MDKLDKLFGADVTVGDGRVTVSRPAALASPAMDRLALAAVFGEQAERDYARWLIWELAEAVGVRPSSIHELYMARGRGEIGGFTVPAMNVRGMAYDTARSIFRTAKKLDAGAFILEIARSEIAYTDQRPSEYVSVILAAALRESFGGPVFIQGDHCQVNAKKYSSDPEGEPCRVSLPTGIRQLRWAQHRRCNRGCTGRRSRWQREHCDLGGQNRHDTDRFDYHHGFGWLLSRNRRLIPIGPVSRRRRHRGGHRSSRLLGRRRRQRCPGHPR